MLLDAPRARLVAAERQVHMAARSQHERCRVQIVRHEHAVPHRMRRLVIHVIKPEMRMAEADVVKFSQGWLCLSERNSIDPMASRMPSLR